MRVTIVDLDWYNHISFLPNPKCMKISSYYKQLRALINFATEPHHLLMDYDEMYVVREKIGAGSFPREIELTDDHVHLIGPGLKFYDRYIADINDEMAACRPDYLLYPLLEENKMANADIVQFYSNGQLIEQMQDYHNTYSKKHFTYITDKGFWLHDEKDIKKCFEKLKKDKNIVFSDGLNLDVIFSNKNKLKMLKKLNIDWKSEKIFITFDNDEKVDQFINFVKSIPIGKRPTMNLTSNIVYSGNHFKQGSAHIRDFHKYFKLITTLKQEGVGVVFTAPPRLLSPYWFFFEDLEGWTTHRRYQSYVEYMTEFACLDHHISLEDMLKTTSSWNDSVYRMIYLWKNYPEIMDEYGYIQWLDRKLDMLDIKKFIKKEKI